MEAATRLRCMLLAVFALISITGSELQAANFRTQNFIIQAPSPQLAQAVGQAAEKYRKELAIHWLGDEIPPWRQPCPIRVVSGPRLAAQGVTTYNLAPVRDFQMEVVGSPERILDSVLPHEITHTLLATHFGRPLPRWADEGICTTVEHVSERNKHEAKLREFLRSRRGIAMNQLFLLTEYPNDVLPMYAQGYSVCRFLIDQKGPQTFIRFLHDYMAERSWTANVRKHYGYESLAELQTFWLAWVANGSGPTEHFVKADRSRPRVMQASATLPGPTRTTPTLNAPQNSLARADTSPPSTHRPSIRSLSYADGRPVASALTQTVDKGWYSRQHESANQNTHPTNTRSIAQQAPSRQAPMAIDSIRAVPPSVRDSGRYSVSQPQPEQGMSQAGQPIGDTFGTFRRYR